MLEYDVEIIGALINVMATRVTVRSELEERVRNASVAVARLDDDGVR